VRDGMVERLRADTGASALVWAVGEVADPLARFFPRRPGDIDELSDDVSLGR